MKNYAHYDGFLDDLMAVGQKAATQTVEKATTKLVSSVDTRINKILGVPSTPPPSPQQNVVYTQPQMLPPPPPQIVQSVQSAPMFTDEQMRYIKYGGIGFGVLIASGLIYKFFLKGDPMAKMMQMMAMQNMSRKRTA